MNIINVRNEQIQPILFYKKYYIYCIVEKDFFIAETIKNRIIFFYQQKHYILIKININSINDHQKIYIEYQQENLFSCKKILLINIQNNNFNNHIISLIKKIYQYNCKKIILIIKFIHYDNDNNIINLNKILKHYNIIIINCNHLSITETRNWIIKNIKKNNLNLTVRAINLLTYYYESNLIKLYNILQILKIIYINKKKVNTICVKKIIEDSVMFSINNWIHALLLNNKTHAFRILKFFKRNQYNVLYIIRSLQINLIYLIYKKENNTCNNYFNKFQQKYILHYQKEQLLIILNNLNYIKLYKIINTIYHIEIDIKKNNHSLYWQYLKLIISIF